MTWSWVKKTRQRRIDQRARLPERLVFITPRCTALISKICDSNISRNVARTSWLPPIVTHVWHARRNCCVCTRNRPSTLSSSPTRRLSPSLGLSTFRTTAFMCHSRQRSEMLPLTDYSVHVQRSASRWRCRSPCPSSGARSWFSSSPGLRSMAPITEMSCWRNTCYQQYDRSLEITLSSCRIARRRIVLATLLSTFSFAQRRSSSPQTQVCQTAQTSTRWTTRSGCDAGSSVQDGDPRPGRSEATSDCRVVRSAAEYRRRRCRSVAQTSALLCGNERPSLRKFAVTLQLELVSFRLADYLIFGYFACLCRVVLPCVAWRNCVINFTVLLCIIFLHMFYRVMKRIYQFAANLLSYIPTKYY